MQLFRAAFVKNKRNFFRILVQEKLALVNFLTKRLSHRAQAASYDLVIGGHKSVNR